MGRFKAKRVFCDHCRTTITKYEEKETDVAIGIKLLELFIEDSCDIVVVITGDTDLAPAVRAAQRLFPGKKVIFAFPYGRKNRELQHLAHGSFKLKATHYSHFQFSDPVTLPNGTTISKPAHW
jgi:uncharacterized LabA/DUF88 family protein